MVTENRDSQEERDAQLVNEAIEALLTGRVRPAETKLLAVIANTPPNYQHQIEQDDGGIAIKFWDDEEFLHYVTWQKEHGGADRNIVWIGNAYPRAHYYMGFLCVKTQRYREAIGYLERGQALEPTNPKFTLEKAQALIQLGDKQTALALYDSVMDVNPHVSNKEIAFAERGRGFVLIEMGRIEEAESAFMSSLVKDPDSQVARNELNYIDHLRQGGKVAPTESVETKTMPVCAVCEKQFHKGIVVNVDGMPVSICARCDRKMSKKWWEFWK